MLLVMALGRGVVTSWVGIVLVVGVRIVGVLGFLVMGRIGVGVVTEVGVATVGKSLGRIRKTGVGVASLVVVATVLRSLVMALRRGVVVSSVVTATGSRIDGLAVGSALALEGGSISIGRLTKVFILEILTTGIRDLAVPHRLEAAVQTSVGREGASVRVSAR